MVPVEGLVILVKFCISVAWKVHAESRECLDFELAHELGRMCLVQDAIVKCLIQSCHLLAGRACIHYNAFEVIEPMVSASVIALYFIWND